ncbi:MAG: hypothetical protein KUG72_10320 [Pseudomonadales bacterium]|nr:hypothetical protein [Pseudomonadales bacterium]
MNNAIQPLYSRVKQSVLMLCLLSAFCIPQAANADEFCLLWVVCISMGDDDSDVQPTEQEILAQERNQIAETQLRHTFGTALYQYQLGNYFQALIEISAAQHRYEADLLQPDASLQSMKTLEAGIMLVYGMENHARAIIDNIASHTLGGVQQDIAWFYLTQLYADKQDWPQAYQTVQYIGEDLPRSLQQKYSRLKANIYINNGRIEEALDLLDDNDDPILEAYTSFNLAIAEQNRNDSDAAYDYLEQITEMDNDQLDIKLLKDRAYLAAAQISATGERYDEAFQYYNRIKIDSPYASEALFGQGWAALYSQNYQQALLSWDMLQTNYALHPQTQQTRIAIPYLYLSMDDPGLALPRYQSAVKEYNNVLVQLDDAKAHVNSGELFGFLDKYKAGAATDWHREPVELPVTEETILIGTLLTQQKIDKDFTALAELYQLKKAINKRHEDLISFQHLVETNDLRHAAITPQITKEIENLQQVEADKKVAALEQQIAEIQKNESIYRLTDEDESDYLARIQKGNKLLDSITDADKKARYKERLDRVNGILLWNLTEAYSERIWQAEKNLKEINASLASAEKTQQKLEVTITQYNNNSDPVSMKVAQIKLDLEQTIVRTEYLTSQQEQFIQQKFLIALNTKREEIRNYLVHSHLAIARLTDSPVMKQEATTERDQPAGEAPDVSSDPSDLPPVESDMQSDIEPIYQGVTMQ